MSFEAKKWQETEGPCLRNFDEKEAIEVFENIINAHQQQIFKEPMHDPKDCIYYMREANKVKVVEKKQEVKEVVEKPTQEKKTQTKKVAK
jgi:hypothetical protein